MIFASDGNMFTYHHFIPLKKCQSTSGQFLKTLKRLCRRCCTTYAYY